MPIGVELAMYYQAIFGDLMRTGAFWDFERGHASGGRCIETLQDFYNNFEEVLALLRRHDFEANMRALAERMNVAQSAVTSAELETRLRCLKSAIAELGADGVEAELVYILSSRAEDTWEEDMLTFLGLYVTNVSQPAESRVNSEAQGVARRPSAVDGKENVRPTDTAPETRYEAPRRGERRAGVRVSDAERRREEAAARPLREMRGNMSVSGNDMVHMRGLLLRMQSLQAQ